MTSNKMEPAVVIHGGAGRISDKHLELKIPVMREALDAAWGSINRGEPAEVAVCHALRVLEGCEYFNAGYGGYPNRNGIVLLDLGLMRGNGDFISILNCRKIKFPSAVALDMLADGKMLMTVWTHELMQKVESSPDEVKSRYGLVSSHEEMIAPFVRKLIEQQGAAELEQSGSNSTVDSTIGSTVGCVVRDSRGNLAAGTSTGGVNLKSNGRIGDTPIVSSGVYADSEVGALSTSGHGESILRSNLSGFVIAALRDHFRRQELTHDMPAKILDAELNEFKALCPKRSAGMILIPRSGKVETAVVGGRFAVARREILHGKEEEFSGAIESI